MQSYSKIFRFFAFDRLVGYATIIGCVATIYGAKKIYNLTVELTPVIKVIKKEQSIPQQVVSDTITVIHRDTVIIKDTIFLQPQHIIESTPKDKDIEHERIRNDEESFRKRHNLP